MDYHREHRLHLEIGPTRNVQTDCYDIYADHLIDRLLRAGISAGVNTDTRTISNISLAEEYDKLNQVFGWGKGEFLQCNLIVLKAIFIPEGTRDELIARLVERYQEVLFWMLWAGQAKTGLQCRNPAEKMGFAFTHNSDNPQYDSFFFQSYAYRKIAASGFESGISSGSRA